MNPLTKWVRLVCALACAAPIFAQSPPLSIATSSPLPNAAQQSAYSQDLTATGGFPPYSWSATAGLPPGLTLSAAGSITGAPTATGSFSFTANVFDAQKNQARKTL